MANGSIITLETGAKLTSNYRNAFSTDVRAVCFDKSLINDILIQDGCTGMRIYFGLDESNQHTAVIVGIDNNGDDMLDCIIDNGASCPINCSTPNDLNPS